MDKTVAEIADLCYIDQLRSDAAFRKRRDIKGVLTRFQKEIESKAETGIRELSRRLYIAEKAVADSEL